jgi:hypothetical protein
MLRSEEAMIFVGKNHYISAISAAKPKKSSSLLLHICRKGLHCYMAISTGIHMVLTAMKQ